MKKIVYLDKFNMHDVKKAGWDGVFIKYESKEKCREIKELLDSHGLIFSSIHAPIEKCNYAFTPECEIFEALIREVIDVASELGIEYVITHPNFRPMPPLVLANGIPTYGRLFGYAKSKGVILCVENLEYEPFVKTILDAHFPKDGCGFCWDTGHNLCYTPSAVYPYPPTYLHLNDNYGQSSKDIPVTDDIHLLPFDGKVDWDSVIAKLKECNYQGHLVLEIKKSQGRIYDSLSDVEYLTLAYEKAREIENRLNN